MSAPKDPGFEVTAAGEIPDPAVSIPPEPEATVKMPAIRVFGVGSAGVKVMETLMQLPVSGVMFTAIVTDARSLAASSTIDRVHLETRLLRGLGTGGDPERGRNVAEEHFPRLKSLCEDVDVVFVIAGLGGGAGTGISPVLARAAKEAGALVLSFVTIPFECEGSRRCALAQRGLDELRATADGVVCLRNQTLFKLLDEDTTVLDAFRTINEFLSDGVVSVWRLLTVQGLIDLHFEDFCELMRDRHLESSFAVAEAMGPTRSREVTDRLLNHPLLEEGRLLRDAEALLISIMGGPDLTMAEVDRVVKELSQADEQTNVIVGAAIDPQFTDRLSVTVIAARHNRDIESAAGRNRPEELDAQLLPRVDQPRHNSRFVPPPPALTPEQMRNVITRQRGRGRKISARQGLLQLEIVSKGRFDKGEPTIHKGEDLDVPTYVRRGVPMN